jgi:hypothetical protein
MLSCTFRLTHMTCQGAWRKVTIDDVVPVDAEGRLLLPTSAVPGELWPMLVAKAVCRVLEPYYEVRLDLPEFGQASVLQLLTGWLPETRALDPALPLSVERPKQNYVFPLSLLPSHASSSNDEVARALIPRWLCSLSLMPSSRDTHIELLQFLGRTCTVPPQTLVEVETERSSFVGISRSALPTPSHASTGNRRGSITGLTAGPVHQRAGTATRTQAPGAFIV